MAGNMVMDVSQHFTYRACFSSSPAHFYLNHFVFLYLLFGQIKNLEPWEGEIHC